jgi:ABC-type Zn uptake system ZnuABC Zn-binding protein ZnuA
MRGMSAASLALLFLAFLPVAPVRAEVRVVVSTIFPLADLARRLVDPSTEVAILLPPGANPHTFEPTPRQLALLERADLLLEVGGGLDSWARKLAGARSTPPPVWTATAVTPLLPAGDHHHGDDPHVWLDPVRMRDYALPALLQTLASLDPRRKEDYERRLVAVRERLTALDKELAARLGAVRGRSYVALHSAWRYFAARYGLVEAATLEPFPGKELSVREMVAIARQIEATGAKALLVEPGLFARLAAQVAAEAGLRLVEVDPYGGPGVPGFDSYEALLRSNAERIAEALR